jgi:type II secretory pathway component PulC
VAVVYAAQWLWHFLPIKTGSSQSVPVADSSPVVEPTDENQMDSAEAEVSADENVAVNNAAVNNAVGVREVLAAHLFGQEAVAKKAAPVSGAVPKTQQPLELHGIVYIPGHPERAVALIAQAGGLAKDYKTGEFLQPLPDWKVFLINPNSVQIEHEGTLELLELPGSKLKLDNPGAIGVASDLQPAGGASPRPQEVTFKKVDDGLVLETSESAAALGLKMEDKIVSISGYDFADLENDPAMLEQLLAQPSIEASVERKGEIINFDVPANLIKTWQTAIKPVN